MGRDCSPRRPCLRYASAQRNTELTEAPTARAIADSVVPALSNRIACRRRRSSCWALPGGLRPPSIERKKGSGVVSWDLERKKGSGVVSWDFAERSSVAGFPWHTLAAIATGSGPAQRPGPLCLCRARQTGRRRADGPAFPLSPPAGAWLRALIRMSTLPCLRRQAPGSAYSTECVSHLSEIKKTELFSRGREGRRPASGRDLTLPTR